MSTQFPYRYTLIRYIHDRRTEEFVNVGVILECSQLGFVASMVDTSYARLSRFFPGANVVAIRSALKSLDARVRARSEAIAKKPADIFKPTASHLEDIWAEVFPKDDSALAFSDFKAGITADPSEAHRRIFLKTVAAYKSKQDKGSRSDEDVWHSIEPAFAQRALSKKLVEYAVRAPLSEYTFEHALRNGRWHCIEPISIDLVNAENIRGKVQKLFGAMSLIRSAATDLNLYFVLSEPTTEAARRMFAEARQVIESVDIPHRVFLESGADQLAEELASRIHH